MGTRGLTVVVQDDEYKVAQYGQWDHYPKGQGRDAAEFLATIMDPMSDDLYEGTALGLFKERVRKVRWATQEECEAIDNIPDWTKTYPYLSRDMGAKILEYIYTHADHTEIILTNQIEFATDGLSCEGIYVVDLDKGTYEVYGERYEDIENPKPFTKDERFRKVDSQPYVTSYKLSYDYYPPRLLKSFNLNDFTIDKYDEWVAEYNKQREEAEED